MNEDFKCLQKSIKESANFTVSIETDNEVLRTYENPNIKYEEDTFIVNNEMLIDLKQDDSQVTSIDYDDNVWDGNFMWRDINQNVIKDEGYSEYTFKDVKLFAKSKEFKGKIVNIVFKFYI